VANSSKIGAGRFSALDSNTSPDTESDARMLTVSEKKSLRDFASRALIILEQKYVVTGTGNGRGQRDGR
jgi:hypothetical protein